MKTLKNLKFWSKKKKKKTTKNHRHSLPPPPCCCYHHHHHHDDGSQIVVQPSAPPLPAWLDYEEQTFNQHLLASDLKFSGLPVSYEARFDPEPEEVEKRSSKSPPKPKATISSSSGEIETDQQYMVENPVYTVPVLQSRRRERSAGAVGCVFNIGAHLFRCFFPCFRIREV